MTWMARIMLVMMLVWATLWLFVVGALVRQSIEWMLP